MYKTKVVNLYNSVAEPIFSRDGSRVEGWVKLTGVSDDKENVIFPVRPENCRPGHSFTVSNARQGQSDVTVNVIS